MKIGVYVGSFDPVHVGHKEVMDYLLQEKYVDKLIVIPTVNYWDKTNLTDIEHRYNMLKFYENDRITIESLSYPYTYQILEELTKKYPVDNLYLIIGVDNLEKFHLWKNFDYLVTFKILVLPRNEKSVSKFNKNFSKEDSFIYIPNFNYIDISSTQIRNFIKEQNDTKIKQFLSPKVYNYIKENNLYRK